MNIRLMQPTDLDKIVEIEKSLFSTPWTKESLQNAFNKSYYQFLIIEKNQEIAGFAILQFILDEAHLINLAIRAEFQNQKLGRALLEYAIAEALQRKSLNIFLEVRKSNEIAKKLYQKLGFQEIDIRRNYYDKPLEDAIIMVFINAEII